MRQADAACARAKQGHSDGTYIGMYTLPKSGQVIFYGVEMTS